MNTSTQKGFTLIELLIVVAIIGLIVAVAAPALLKALDQGKQKATLADLRSVGVALERYYIDSGSYPVIKTWADADQTLRPDYLRGVPEIDAWGNSLLWECSKTSCTIQALCKSGLPDPLPGMPLETEAADFTRDIIWQDGGFLQRPAGYRAQSEEMAEADKPRDRG